MLTSLGTWIHANTQWLYTRLYENPLFFFDLWSINHFTSGFLLFALLRRAGLRRPWFALAAALLAYELLELAFIFAAFGAFRPETLKDQLTDLVVGAAGAVAFQALAARGWSAARVGHPLALAFVVLSFSYLWVGSYGYRYDHPALNSPGLNWYAFTLWASGLFGLLLLFSSAERRLGGLRAAAVTCGLYFVALFVIEAIGYRVLGIHEVGHPAARPLAFDLIHGTRGLFAFYLSVPLTSVGGLLLARRFFTGALAVAPASSRDQTRAEPAQGSARVEASPSSV